MTHSVSADTPEAGRRALGAVPLLAGLRDDALEEVWHGSPPRYRPAGQVLKQVGDPAESLLLLMRGRVAASTTTRSGRVVRHGTWTGPCALDKVAVLDGRGHTATLTALTACVVRSLPRARFLSLIDDAASVRHHVLRVLSGHARAQQRRFTATATLSAEARLAMWLLEEAAAVARRSVTLPGSQQALADLLAVSRVTVNRALTRLRNDGLIAFDRHTVTLLAPELLELRAQG